MKRSRRVAGASPAVRRIAGAVVAVAMTWDGARWPAHAFPVKARDFLKAKAGKPRGAGVPSAKKLAEYFTDDQVSEIRVCWVPRLKGGGGVLAEPFQTAAGKRIGFQSVKAVRFGDILGVVYRRR